MEQWSTINQIAKELNIPETTCRRYFGTFKEYLNGKKFGKIVKYDDRVVNAIEAIYKGYEKGYNTAQIKEELEKEFNRIIEVRETSKNEQALTTITTPDIFIKIMEQNETIIETFTRALNENTEALRIVADQQEEIKSLRNEIEALKGKGILSRLFKK